MEREGPSACGTERPSCFDRLTMTDMYQRALHFKDVILSLSKDSRNDVSQLSVWTARAWKLTRPPSPPPCIPCPRPSCGARGAGRVAG